MRIIPGPPLRRIILAALAAAVAARFGPVSLRADSTPCTPITVLPATINSEGVHCLTSDFSLNLGSGAAITVQANNVVLDLNGRKIGNLSAGPSNLAIGILAEQRQNVTVRNGTLRGFAVGVALNDGFPFGTPGYLVEDLRVDHSTFKGIQVGGVGGVVRRNLVVVTGPGALDFMGSSFGIELRGRAARAIDNDVVTVTGSGGEPGVGIAFYDGEGIALNNRISVADFGIVMQPSVKYRDNVTTAVAQPYLHGTDLGNNN